MLKNNYDRYAVLKGFCKELSYSEEEIEKLIHPFIKFNIYLEHAKSQILCENYLRKMGYEVELEKEISKGLRCDVFAKKGGETLIVEVEANKEGDWIREVSKVARYSRYADKFVLGIPSYREPKIPKEFLRELFKPPELRDEGILKKIKQQVGEVYTKPTIPLEEFKNSKLTSIYLIDVENKRIEEKHPLDFL
jgi:hypothetical protein